MLTSIWGPSQWHFLHCISFNYPVEPTAEQKRQYRDYVLSLRHILPCKYCRINLEKNLQKLPLTEEHMQSRATFSRYIYDLHELVNKMLGKKSGLSFEDARDRYEHFRSRCNKTRRRRARVGGRGRESGCVDPMHNKKLKCVLKIIPRTQKCKTFQFRGG